MNWEIKHSGVSGYSVSPSMGSVGDQGAQPSKLVFSLKLVCYYSFLKIIKLKLSVSNKKNCYCNLKYTQCLFLVLLRLKKTQRQIEEYKNKTC